MKKKHFAWIALFILITNVLMPFKQMYDVFADEQNTTSGTIIDNSNVSIGYTAKETNDGIEWKFDYTANSDSETSQRLKFEFTADGQSIAFNQSTGWNYSDSWFVQDDFNEKSSGTINLNTTKEVTKVSLRVQADTEIQDEKTDAIIEKNIFSSDTEGPHQLAVPVIEQSTEDVDSVVDEETESTTESQQEATEPSETEESKDLVNETTVVEEKINNQNIYESSNRRALAGGIVPFYEPMDYPNVVPDYENDEDGIYPSSSWTPTGNSDVINHQGKEFGTENWDGNISWDGNPDNITDSYIEYANTDGENAFSLRKYARETATPGLYDVYLNVRGNQYTPIEPIDIVLVIDMSGSMESSANNGYNDRAGAVRDGVKDFFANINNTQIAGQSMGDYVNVGFVGYSSPGYIDLVQEPIKPASDVTHVNNINTALSPTFSGGTFTQHGIEVAHNMLASSSNDKIMIVITDGVPTWSKRVMNATTIDGTVYGTDFHSSDQDEPGSTARLLYGAWGSWSGYSSGWNPAIGSTGYYYDTSNNVRIWDTWAATLGQAKIAKDDGITVNTLGIQLGADTGYLNAGQVRDRASLIASSGLYEDAESTQDVTDYLVRQADQLIKYLKFATIHNGSISDPIGDQFFYESNNVTVRSVGETEITDLPEPTITDGQMNVDELFIGEGQELQFHYQVRIDTEDPDFVPERWYQINGPTKLTPDGNNPSNQVDFAVPSAKAPGIKLNLEKLWEEYDNDESSRPEYLDFSVERETNVSGDWTGYVRLDDENDWKQEEFEQVAKTEGGAVEMWLPQFNNEGTNFDYTFTELNVPDGYESSPNDDGTIWTNTKIFVPLGLKIIKVSDQDQETLTGATFRLTGVDLPDEGIILEDKGEGIYELPDTSDKLQLDSEYTLTEIEPPAGHKASTAPWLIKVSETGVVTINDEDTDIVIEDNTINYIIENEFDKLVIATEKYAQETDEQLDGARLTLKKHTENWEDDGVVVGDEHELIANDSTLTKELEPGYYSLQETTVPTGYQEDDTLYKFEVTLEGELKDEEGNVISSDTRPTSDGWYISDSNDTTTFVFAKFNELRKFEFSILKKDSQSNQLLQNATFELSELGSDDILATLTTDENGLGKFIVSESDPEEVFLLQPGEYTLQEIAAPNGYVVLSGIFQVVVSDEGEVTVTYDGDQMNQDTIDVSLNDEGNNTIELTIANTPKGLLPSTGGTGRQIFLIGSIAILGMTGLIGGYYVYRNRKGAQ